MQVLYDNSRLAGIHRCVFVPTMGALHDGHFTLIRRAAQIRDERAVGAPVVVSIFVNPTQFNDPADLSRYPRTLEADIEGCRRAGADAVYAPGVQSVYPPEHAVLTPPLPRVATTPGLEEAHRPGHFAGVCQVVRRLFELVQPSHALFGEKDWQQLAVIRAMADATDPGVSIVGVPTVRERDGLAMSSRNVFLSREGRLRALAISRALRAAAAITTVSDAEARMRDVLAESGLVTEYAVVRDSTTLLLLPPEERAASMKAPARALIAARLESVRLIDNAPWPEESFTQSEKIAPAGERAELV